MNLKSREAGELIQGIQVNESRRVKYSSWYHAIARNRGITIRTRRVSDDEIIVTRIEPKDDELVRD